MDFGSLKHVVRGSIRDLYRENLVGWKKSTLYLSHIPQRRLVITKKLRTNQKRS
jgi:hypothetical protein